MVSQRVKKVTTKLLLATVLCISTWTVLKVVPKDHPGSISTPLTVNAIGAVPKVTIPEQWCLHVDPSMRKDEFAAARDGERITRVCPEDYNVESAWHVTFNIERSYRFKPERQQNQTEYPLEYFTNVTAHSDKTPAQKGKIPKLFHFIWSTEIIPSEFVGNLKSFRTKHPDWTIHFWTLAAGRKFIVKHEPQILTLYDGFKNVFKADVLRYALIYHMGGAYFDIDSRVIKPIDELAENFECILGPEPMENPVTILGVSSLLANSALLCRPKHPFFRHVIDLIPVHGTGEPGPLFMSKCFPLFLDRQLRIRTAVNESFEIKIIPHDYFEYVVLKGYGVDKQIVRICVIYKQFVLKYLQECGQIYNKISTDEQLYIKCERKYRDIYQTIPKVVKKKEERRKMEFDACVEWVSHGEENRRPSTNRFVEHVHYGTHKKEVFKTLKFMEANNISKIIQDVHLHV